MVRVENKIEKQKQRREERRKEERKEGGEIKGMNEKKTLNNILNNFMYILNQYSSTIPGRCDGMTSFTFSSQIRDPIFSVRWSP